MSEYQEPAFLTKAKHTILLATDALQGDADDVQVSIANSLLAITGLLIQSVEKDQQDEQKRLAEEPWGQEWWVICDGSKEKFLTEELAYAAARDYVALGVTPEVKTFEIKRYQPETIPEEEWKS